MHSVRVSYSPPARLRVHNTHSQSELSVQSPGPRPLFGESTHVATKTEQSRFASGSLYRDRRNTQIHAQSDGKHKTAFVDGPKNKWFFFSSEAPAR